MLRYLAPAADASTVRGTAAAAAAADAIVATAVDSDARPQTPVPSQPQASLPPQPSDGDGASDGGGDARVAELTVAVGGDGGGIGGDAWAAAAARIFAARGAVLLTGVLSEEACAGLRALLKEVASTPLTPSPDPNPNPHPNPGRWRPTAKHTTPLPPPTSETGDAISPYR